MAKTKSKKSDGDTILEIVTPNPTVPLSPSETSFLQTKEMITELVDQVKQIKITDTTSLAIANQKLSTVNNHLKEIEEKRVELKAPFKKIVDDIDGTAKQLKTILEDGIKYIKGEIVGWNTKLQQEQKAAEETAKKAQEDAENIEKEKKVVGYIGQVKGWLEVQFNAPGNTADSCHSMLTEIGNLPDASLMGKYSAEYSALIDMYIRLFNSKMAELKGDIEVGSTEKHVETLGNHLSTQINNIQQEVSQKEQSVVAAVENVTAVHNNVMEQQASNVRKNWTFELVDITKVPAKWLQLNEKAVEAWKKENKDTLTENVEINGVKFFTTMSVVTK